MPVPTICLESTFRQYVESFRSSFSLPRFEHFVSVLAGLTPEHRTLSGLLGRVAAVGSLSALSRFMTQTP